MLLNDLGCDSIHVGGSLLGERLADHNLHAVFTHKFCSSDESSSFKLNEAVTDVLTGCLAAVLGVSAIALVATVVLAEGVHTDLLSHVELVGDGSRAGVEPVTVLRREFFSARGLNVLCPLKYIIIKNKVGKIVEGVVTYVGDLDLVTFLQMLRECRDEFCSRDVLDGVSVLINESEVLLKTLVNLHRNATTYFHLDVRLYDFY